MERNPYSPSEDINVHNERANDPSRIRDILSICVLTAAGIAGIYNSIKMNNKLHDQQAEIEQLKKRQNRFDQELDALTKVAVQHSQFHDSHRRDIEKLKEQINAK